MNTEELRIIATDANLSHQDKQTLQQFADEIDVQAATLIMCQEALIQSQGHRIALGERILELQSADKLKPYEIKVRYGVGD